MNTVTSQIRSIAAVISVAAMTMAVTAALPSLAFAQDYSGDLSSGDSGCCDTSSYYDTYSPDTSSYYDTYSPDTSSYYDTYSPDTSSYYDTYSPDTSSNYYDTYTADNSSSDYYDTYTPDTSTYYDSYTPDYSSVDYSSSDIYGTSGYSTPSYSYSTPSVFSAPASYGYAYNYETPTPIIPSAPVVINTPPSYQPTPPVVTQPNVITNNTCTNYSCNTVTNVSNSGNTVTTVVPVATAPVTYPAQYTIPTYNYQNVSCTISASPNSVQGGQYTYLTWQSYGATSATLTNYGNVAPSGSLSVQPYGSTSYVLTVYGQNGQTATCNTYVTVGTAYQTPSVTLSQIPYTGFDFGTVGDAAYWAMLLAFALSAGYLLVYYKGGAAAFAGALIPVRRKASVSHPAMRVEKNVAPAPVIEREVETPAPAKAATFESLPAFSNVRPTHDSMSIASPDGAPRIVINRS